MQNSLSIYPFLKESDVRSTSIITRTLLTSAQEVRYFKYRRVASVREKAKLLSLLDDLVKQQQDAADFVCLGIVDVHQDDDNI